jgi:hypothetical protein
MLHWARKSAALGCIHDPGELHHIHLNEISACEFGTIQISFFIFLFPPVNNLTYDFFQFFIIGQLFG